MDMAHSVNHTSLGEQFNSLIAASVLQGWALMAYPSGKEDE
jgi:hypothetical protein